MTLSPHVEYQLLTSMEPGVRARFFADGLGKLAWVQIPDQSPIMQDPETYFAKTTKVPSRMEDFRYQPNYIVHREPWKGDVPPNEPKYSVYLAIGAKQSFLEFNYSEEEDADPYTPMWICLFQFPVDVTIDEVESIRSAVVGQMASITDMIEQDHHLVLDYPIWISTSEPPRIVEEEDPFSI